jgi:hypothetical protein
VGSVSSESRTPELKKTLGKTSNAMEAMETDRSRPRQVRYQAALRPDSEIFKFTAKFCSLLVFVLRVAGEMPRNTRSTGAAWSVGPAAALFRE